MHACIALSRFCRHDVVSLKHGVVNTTLTQSIRSRHYFETSPTPIRHYIDIASRQNRHWSVAKCPTGHRSIFAGVRYWAPSLKTTTAISNNFVTCPKLSDSEGGPETESYKHNRLCVKRLGGHGEFRRVAPCRLLVPNTVRPDPMSQRSRPRAPTFVRFASQLGTDVS